MTRTTIVGLIAITALTAGTASAQVKSIAGDSETKSATVEAIEKATRQVTLKGEDGKYEVLYVPEDVKRFDTLKVGETVKIRYYETVVLRPHEKGAKPIDTMTRGTVPAAEGARGGTASAQRTITATITAIDPKVPSITFSGPNGWNYTSRVQDKAALANAKVGDLVDITWTSATLLSIDDAK